MTGKDDDTQAGELAAARAMNASLLREYQGLAKELQLLRDHYEELEQALAQARADCEEVRDLVSRAELHRPGLTREALTVLARKANEIRQSLRSDRR